ncbi:helix-turn-helix transcriptional regulator [Enterococcus hirae]|jgi:predicted transcriptional regulator YheO|nr:helix-turn-helix transcriptional regulator [Enterococcus hirae]
MLSDDKLKFLRKLAKTLAIQFGENCEIVIHQIDEDHIDNSIITIENGHVSSRHLGDGPSQIVLKAMNADPQKLEDQVNYLTRTHDGRVLKSSTLYLKNDETGKLEGVFAINFDITTLIAAENMIKSIITVPTEETSKDPDYIPQNVNELLEDLIQESVKLVGKPVAMMTKEDKIKSIQFLNDKGAFLITKSGDKISKFFNISKYTLYSYIDAK